MKTITRMLKRLIPPVIACACGALATVLLIRLGVAHAAAQLATAPAAGPQPGIDWNFWLGALATALAAASLFLHWLAPRTKNTIDDKLRDDIDEVLAFARSSGVTQTGTGGTAAATATLTIAKPPSSTSGAALLAVLLLGALAAPALTGCGSTTKSVATTAEHDLVNCTGTAIGTTPALDAATLLAVAELALTERAKCTPAGGSLDWTCVEHDAEAEGKVLGGCTLVALVTGAPAGAGSGSAAPVAPTRIAAAGVVRGPSAGIAALDTFRQAKAPGATFHASAGDF